MSMQVKIRMVGRKGDKWQEEACSVYQKRLLPNQIELQTEFHKNNDALRKGIEMDQSKGHVVVLLDPVGVSTYTSERFATDFYTWMEQGGSRLSFVIGGGMLQPYCFGIMG